MSRRSGRARALAAVLALPIAIPLSRAAAQEAPDSLGPAVRCSGQTVSAVRVRSGPPDFSRVVRRLRFLQRASTEVHVPTREDVVRRFLLLEPGRPCTEFRRAESERILRAQPFIADASVTAHDDGAGGVVIDAVTEDELSILAGVDVRGAAPHVRGARLGNQNVMGRAVAVEGRWQEGIAYRDEFGFDVTHYQLFGRPYQLALGASRASLGGDWEAEGSHPFLTDLQRVAWWARKGMQEGYFTFARGAHVPAPSILVDRGFVDLGGIVRIGEPGRLSLFGVSFTRERAGAEDAPVIITDSGLVGDTTSAFAGRFARHRSARVNAIWGLRNVHFMRVTAFDALRGAQDVRIGMQFGVLAGRSLAVLGSESDDILLSSDLYAGFGSRRSFGAIQVSGEGRQNYDTNQWDGILASGRAAGYFRPADTHTIIASAEYAGGWRQLAPFQLRLDDPQGGVRGFGGSLLGGAQRAVLRLEDRWYLGTPRGVADAGLAMFVDAGKLWAGRSEDAIFAVTTPVRVGVGVGLLAAFPPGSKRLFRLDVALPVTREPGARFEIRFGNADATRSFWTDPGDVARSRVRTVPSSIFSWP